MTALLVSTHQAKSRLSELIREAERGREVIILRGGQPVAKLLPWRADRPARLPGAWSGQVRFHADIVGPDDDVNVLFDRSLDTP